MDQSYPSVHLPSECLLSPSVEPIFHPPFPLPLPPPLGFLASFCHKNQPSGARCQLFAFMYIKKLNGSAPQGLACAITFFSRWWMFCRGLYSLHKLNNTTAVIKYVGESTTHQKRALIIFIWIQGIDVALKRQFRRKVTGRENSGMSLTESGIWHFFKFGSGRLSSGKSKRAYSERLTLLTCYAISLEFSEKCVELSMYLSEKR